MKHVLLTAFLLAGALFFQSCDNQNNTNNTGTETGTDITGVGGTEATINNDGVDSAIDSSAAIEAPVQTP